MRKGTKVIFFCKCEDGSILGGAYIPRLARGLRCVCNRNGVKRMGGDDTDPLEG